MRKDPVDLGATVSPEPAAKPADLGPERFDPAAALARLQKTRPDLYGEAVRREALGASTRGPYTGLFGRRY